MSAITGEDIEDALSMIESEGGVGEWESDEGAGSGIPRWLFPRFVPPCPTCHTPMKQDTKDNEDDPGFEITFYTCGEHGGEHQMDAADMYMSRSGIGPYDTDVETLAAWLEAPRNIVGATLLLGEPGTGKTALIEAVATHLGRPVTTVVCTPDHTKDSLFLRFVGEGKGDPIHPDDPASDLSPYTLGPIPYAAKHGHILYLDEFMLLIDGVKPLTYPLADGRRFLPEGNVDGSPLEVHPDFRLVLSSNPLVRGASLPEPVASRCASTTLTVETDVKMLRDLGLAEEVVAAWEALGNANLWRPQIRELRLADYWLGVDAGQAVSAFVPEHCPESDREAVTQAVVGFLGGDIRKDGRLVVS